MSTDDGADRDAPAGSKSRSLWLVQQLREHRAELFYVAISIARLVRDVERDNAWQATGAVSFEDFCLNAFGMTAIELEQVLGSLTTTTIA